MKETRKTLTRRVLVTGVALAAAVPAVAAAPTLSGSTPIARLWGEAEVLGAELGAHRAAIAKAASLAGDGTPGWMRLGGKANRLAEARYGKLIAILKETPKSAGDLKIISKVSQDGDILAGARGWASERLASATLALVA